VLFYLFLSDKKGQLLTNFW